MLYQSSATLRDFVNILKNGRNIYFLAGLDTPLDDGDTITLFPPAAGDREGRTAVRATGEEYHKKINKKNH